MAKPNYSNILREQYTVYFHLYFPVYYTSHNTVVEKCVKLESAVFKTILNSLQCLAACTQSSTRISLIAENGKVYYNHSMTKSSFNRGFNAIMQ